MSGQFVGRGKEGEMSRLKREYPPARRRRVHLLLRCRGYHPVLERLDVHARYSSKPLRAI
jgi:hypothetical protein